jgi:hypothetical protein
MRFIDSPTELSGCIMWFDGMDRSSITADATGSVSQWSDKSGLDNHAVQTDNTRRPFFSVTASNGMPGLDWTSTVSNGRGLQVSDISLSTYTVLAVCRGEGGGTYLYVHVDDTTGDYLFTSTNATSAVRRSAANSFFDITPNWSVGTPTSVLTKTYGGSRATHNVWVNGVKQPTKFIINGGFGEPGLATLTGTFFVGKDANSAIGWRGKMHEFIVFGRPLSDAERSMVERYLNRKWGVHSDKQQLTNRSVISPLEVPGCTLWLDAADAASITRDGSTLVSAWNDKSGAGNNFAQSTATNRPLYTTNGIDFDGTDNSMVGPAASTVISASDYTLFCVFVADGIGTSAGGTTPYANDGLVTDASAFLGMHLRTSGGQPQVVAYNWDGNADFVTAEIGVGQRMLATQTHDAGRLSIAAGGITQANAPSNNTTNITSAIQLGRNNSGDFFDGRILEVVAFNRALSGAERVLVERYLGRKWL